jgi:DNA-binding MarR family transcriptional regulator
LAKTEPRTADSAVQTEAGDSVDRVLAAWQRERPDLDFSPWAVTRRLDRLSRRLHYTEQMYEPFGLNRGGVEVLAALRSHGPGYQLSPTDLCGLSLVTSATMTNRLDRLEQDELVRRLPDPTDRRALIVEMTPKGREVIDELITAVVARRADQISGLDPDEQLLLAQLLRKLLLSVEGPNPQDAE